MSRIDKLAGKYEKHISAPWQRNLAGAQKTIFVVYPKEDERKLRSHIGEFKNRTELSGHSWSHFDMTKLFAQWMSETDYREQYFECPEDLKLKLNSEFFQFVVDQLVAALTDPGVDEDTVVAVTGAASLFGFVKVSEVLEKSVHENRGRLVLFFPGTYDKDSYWLLDARDGWNYLATPIALHSGE
jgi:hypothetical protein